MIAVWRKFKAFWRYETRGVVAIEFALLGPLGLAVMIGVFEVAVMMMAQNMLDKSAQMLTHQIKAGFALDGSLNIETAAADFACGANEAGGVRSTMFFDCDEGLQVFVRGFDVIASVELPEPGPEGAASQIDIPQRGQFVVLRLFYDWQFYTPLVGNMARSGGMRPLLRSGSVFRIDN